MKRIEDEPSGDESRSLRDRVASAARAAATLARTRLEIFGEEFSVKAGFAGKGLAAGVLAGALGIGVVLLLAALIAAIFTAIFHSLILGILAAMLLYAIGAGLLGWMAWTMLSKVRPSEFPATQAELSKDLAAVRSALRSEEGLAAAADAVEEPDSSQVEDLERRLRAGAE
jgi:predicted lipid-binding transport protein (Tim44 family)